MPATPIHHTATTSDTEAWDGPAAVKALDTPLTEAIGNDEFAWRDPDADPSLKGSWRFAHHQVTDGKPGAANVKACLSGIGVLHGGMQGTTIPAADHAGVEAHLRAHLKDANMTHEQNAEVDAETRADAPCPTCDGSGTIMDGNRKCPDCSGSGDAPESKSAEVPAPLAPVVIKSAPVSSVREWQQPVSARVEIRMDGNHSAGFVGYASTTGQGYDVTDFLGSYRETVNPGAFAKTLRESENVPLLFNHDGMPVAATRSGTSRLSEDAHGLRNEADLDRRQALSNDLCIALERGDLSQMSFSFAAVKQAWNTDYSDRQVQELRLYDTSIVTYPANPTTTAGIRAEMREAMGREGVGLMWSLRSAMTEMHDRALPTEAESVLDQAIRALRTADETVVSRFGRQGRARTLLVADLMLQVRAGKVLSAANQTLLEQALAALHAADDHLDGIDAALDEGQRAISSVLDVADPDDDDPDTKSTSNGTGEDTPGATSGDPTNPADGAGPRSTELPAEVRQAQMEDELRRIRLARTN